MLIAVTGASGLLGANLVLYLQQRGHNVIAMYYRHKFIASGVKSLCVDLTDKYTVSSSLGPLQPDWIIHCAALTNVDYCEEHPEDAYRVNVKASSNLAVLAHQTGAGLVYVSTNSVFGGGEGPYSEEDLAVPVNVYSQSKLAGENYVQRVLGSSIIIRTSPYGWNMQAKHSLAEWILNRLERGQTVPGFYDEIITPILTLDLSEIIVEMIERQLTGLFHVGGAQSYSKYEFALSIADVFGQDRRLVQPVSVKESSLKAPRPGEVSLRTNKISWILGRTMPDLISGLQRFKALRDLGFVTRLKVCGGG